MNVAVSKNILNQMTEVKTTTLKDVDCGNMAGEMAKKSFFLQ